MTEPTLAYRDEEFLDSDDGRPLRILAEYLGPLRAFRSERVHDTVVFFGSARLRQDGPLGRYYDDARELARRLTEWSLSLPCEERRFVVCTGGGGGIMEAANRGAREPRTAAESLRHARAQLRVSLLLHAQALVRPLGAGDGRLPGRLRDARRAL